MANAKFLIKKQSTHSEIYCRFTEGRNIDISRKTGLTVDANNWNNKKGLSKEKGTEGKKLNSNLRKLAIAIIDSYNSLIVEGEEPNKLWFSKTIDKFFKRKEPESLEYLTSYANYYIQQLPFKQRKNNKIGASPQTIAKYTNIKNKLVKFEEQRGKRVSLTDVNKKLKTELLQHFKQEENLSDSYIGRLLSTIKTFAIDAQKNGHPVSTGLSGFVGFKIKHEFPVLSFEEIEQIKNTILPPHLENVRDWLIIGCYTGQRASDLFKMNTKFISKTDGYDFINLEQEKTKKKIQIPIHYEVQEILTRNEGKFPELQGNTISSNETLFNRYVKEVCRIAGITEMTKGFLYNPKTKRQEEGEYPKWKLISSHTCRRSFATNFYSLKDYPTPLLMNMTGHETERQFLEYINKPQKDYSIQLAEIWLKQAQSNLKQPQMNLIEKETA